MTYNPVREEVYGMKTARLEVRIDPEQRRKLAKIADERKVAVSAALREMIDAAYEEIMREYRRRLVDELASIEIEDVPDPEELSRQLESTYDLPDLY